VTFHRTAFYAVALCVSIAPGVAAQGAAKSIGFGVVGGAAFSKPAGEDAGGTDIGPFVNTYTAFAAGGFVRLGISRLFTIQPELLYIQKGAKFLDDAGAPAGRLKVGYVQIPVLVQVRIPTGPAGFVSPHVYAGPAVGFKAGCKLREETGTGYTSCEDGGQKLKGSDFSVVFGGGVDIGRAVIDVRYDYGFSKLEDISPPSNVKNRTLYLLAGWRFGHPK